MAAPYDHRNRGIYQNFGDRQPNTAGELLNNTNLGMHTNQPQHFNQQNPGFDGNRPNFQVPNMRMPPPPFPGQHSFNLPPPGPRFDPNVRQFGMTRLPPRNNFNVNRFGPPHNLQTGAGFGTLHQMQLPQPPHSFQSNPQNTQMVHTHVHQAETNQFTQHNVPDSNLKEHYIKQKRCEDAKWIEDFVNSRKGQSTKERKVAVNVSMGHVVK